MKSEKKRYKVLQIYRNSDDMYAKRKLAHPRWLNTYEALSPVRAIFEAVVEFGDKLDVTYDLLTTEEEKDV
jgi:hypothetical protein